MDRTVADIVPFPTPPRLFAHPDGAPAGLTLDPTLIDAAALALASALSKDWSALTPEQHEAFRRAVLLAAWCTDSASLALVARHISRRTHDGLHATDTYVRDRVEAEHVLGLLAAMRAVSGTLPNQHAALVALKQYDLAVAQQRRMGGR